MEHSISDHPIENIPYIDVNRKYLVDRVLNLGAKSLSWFSEKIYKLNSAYRRILNNSSFLKKSGTLEFSNGFTFSFDDKTKNHAKILADLSVNYGDGKGLKNYHSKKISRSSQG